MTYDLEPHGRRWLGFGGLLLFSSFQPSVEVVNQFNFNFDLGPYNGHGWLQRLSSQETIFMTIFLL